MISCSTKLKHLSRSLFTNLKRFSSTKDNLPPQSAQKVSQLLDEAFVAENDSKVIEQTDPDDENIILFPGQGSLKVGMVKDLLKYENVPEMFDAASQIFNADILKLCQSGPQSELEETYVNQPAVFLTSLAGIEKVQHERPDILENCTATAGFSIGEFAALVFSGAMEFEDALELIKVRARAMQRASGRQQSEMVTCVGKSSTKFKNACSLARDYCFEELKMEFPVCNVTANLAPNLVTIGGHSEAVDFLRLHKGELNIRKIMKIPVSGAFHTELMDDARLDLKKALKHVELKKPLIDVYSNFTGKKYRNSGEIKKKLPLQVVKPILWEPIVSQMVTRPRELAMPAFYEVGPGSQLGTLLRMCNGRAHKNYSHVDNITIGTDVNV